MLMTVPDAATITTWATASAILIIAVRQQLDAIEAKKNAKLAKNTNDLVNGQHGKALETIVQQATQISAITGSPEDKQRLLDAKKSLSDHSEQEKGG